MNEAAALQRMEPEGGEITVHQPLPPPALFGTVDPVEVVAKASRVAAALKDVVRSQGLISKISGKEYPRCEAWTLLGTMLGVFPVLEWSRPVDGGWEARVEAKTMGGQVVGAAEAQCLRSERNWANRDDFALRSMAQTRATAKALRMPLGFVMTLGGFQPTPAEEMDFQQPPERPRTSAPAKPPGEAALPPATEEGKARFLALLAPVREAALAYFYAKDILEGPGPDWPGEPIEILDLKYVPRSKGELRRLMAAIQAHSEGQEAPQTPQGAGSHSEPENSPEADSERSEATADADPESDVESLVGSLEEVSEKSGRSSKGPWTRFGFKVAGMWFSTFDKTLAACAAKDKGHSVRVYFKRGEKGNTLAGIERAKNG